MKKTKNIAGITALLFFLQIFFANIETSAQESSIPNSAFCYFVGATTHSHNPKDEDILLNWNVGFNRYLGSRQENGGSVYLGLEYNSKLVFKRKLEDSLSERIVSTATGDFALGFAIQNNLSTLFSGSTIKLTAGAPLARDNAMKFHFGVDLRMNVNFVILEDWFGGQNLVGMYLEVGGDGLVYNNKVLPMAKFGLGVTISALNKEMSGRSGGNYQRRYSGNY